MEPTSGHGNVMQTPVCGIGASAGGIGALQALFRDLPDDLGLAYVVIVHLAPDHPSALAEILAMASKMPVAPVTDSLTLQPNCIYVIAPESELVISGNSIQASAFNEARGRRTPIDRFFHSISSARGDGIAVILTGAGSDGTSGVKAIKEAGGVVLVQDPAEAEFASMPRNAIATGCADLVASIAGLAVQIAEVARSKEAVRSLDMDAAANDLRRIVGFLHARTGHDFASYKRPTVRRRVLRRMQVRRMTSLSAYAEYLKETPEEADDLFRDMLISVTHFFRDPEAFETLTTKAIAPIFDDVGADGIRAWVAGCATGEEAYSLAILLKEEAERRKLKVPIQIFATDLDEGALGMAREGRYPNSIQAEMSAERLQRFFLADGSHYRFCEEIRDMVLFATHSVLKDPPFLRLDLISCRNLLIYLERGLQEKLYALFHYALLPQRYLFLGSAETADVANQMFAAVDRESRLYCTKPRPAQPMPILAQRYSAPDVPAPPARPAAKTPPGTAPAVLHGLALEEIAPASILVDERSQIVHLSPSAGRYLRHSGGTFSDRLDQVVCPELRIDLGYALGEALLKAVPTLTPAVSLEIEGARRRIALNVVPIRDGHRSQPHALVMFLDGGPDTLPESAEAATADGRDRDEQVRRLQAELVMVRDSLSSSRNDHEHAAQDLRVANEELQSINEEYRSTSEELETSKEELQSMNEELQTVNSELKVKLESISTAHNDLRNLTAATEIGTLFLDGELRIRMFTPSVAELFNIVDGDVGRPLADFTNRLIRQGIEEELRQVLGDHVPLEIELKDQRGRCFMMRVRPYRTLDDRIEGVVVTFVDISTWRLTESRLELTEHRYQTLFDSLDQGFCVIEMLFDAEDRPTDYRFLEVNPAFQRQTGLSDVIGKTMHELQPGIEDYWFETYGRIARTHVAERFEAAAAKLDHFYEVYAFPLGSPGDNQVGVLFHDIRERKEAEREREMLTHELSHRVKNTLAVVQGLANQTSRDIGSVDEFRASFIGRLEALGHAHTLLLDSQWQSADLVKLIDGTLKAYDSGKREAIKVSGSSVRLTPKQGLGLALILHELASNAVKYGALSVPEGRLEILLEPRDADGQAMVRLHWRESGGPPVTPPERKGFGTRLIERASTYELRGRANLSFEPEGLRAEIDFPFEQEPQ